MNLSPSEASFSKTAEMSSLLTFLFASIFSSPSFSPLRSSSFTSVLYFLFLPFSSPLAKFHFKFKEDRSVSSKLTSVFISVTCHLRCHFKPRLLFTFTLSFPESVSISHLTFFLILSSNCLPCLSDSSACAAPRHSCQFHSVFPCNVAFFRHRVTPLLLARHPSFSLSLSLTVTPKGLFQGRVNGWRYMTASQARP